MHNDGEQVSSLHLCELESSLDLGPEGYPIVTYCTQEFDSKILSMSELINRPSTALNDVAKYSWIDTRISTSCIHIL